ncbi:uncharacterized protein G2W53_029240 [Senna tora]|uniref:Uncharacterized protein n=1 Tax=Senna tora TaxID=362788 RepID=A0A834WDJ1_9FABA|nr:uncharacterized protein G2W53_029240 [Senna tora]
MSSTRACYHRGPIPCHPRGRLAKKLSEGEEFLRLSRITSAYVDATPVAPKPTCQHPHLGLVEGDDVVQKCSAPTITHSAFAKSMGVGYVRKHPACQSCEALAVEAYHRRRHHLDGHRRQPHDQQLCHLLPGVLKSIPHGGCHLMSPLQSGESKVDAKVAVVMDVTMDVLEAESYGVCSVFGQCVVKWCTVSRGYCNGTVTRRLEV